MGFFGRLFRKKNIEETNVEEWDKLVFSREHVDFRDEQQRSRYVAECLEQISEASKETNLLTGEYTLVTAYLTDIEEIEALPEEEKGEVTRCAHKISVINRDIDRFREHGNKMEDADFYRIRSKESEIEEGIEKLRKCEEYGELVKQDLVRLDRERNAYSYRKQDLINFCANLKGMVTIFIVALVLTLLLFWILAATLEMKTVEGSLIAVTVAAVAILVSCMKYIDAQKELKLIDRDITKLIGLQNKVKIRYVNNMNLWEYLRMKYNTDSSAKLKKLWSLYKKEQELRRQAGEAEAKLQLEQTRLVKLLSRYRLKDPARWVGQVNALLDPREMVEIRHELILRRQALRKQMDYNATVAQNAKNEIMDITRLYPGYANEILKMLEQYDDTSVDF